MGTVKQQGDLKQGDPRLPRILARIAKAHEKAVARQIP